MLSMRKLTSAALAAAVSASLLVAPAATAADTAEDRSSSSSTSVTRDRDNAGAIPDGYELPEQPPFGSAYTGFAPLSILLAAAAVAGILGAIAQFPPVQAELDKFREQLPL